MTNRHRSGSSDRHGPDRHGSRHRPGGGGSRRRPERAGDGDRAAELVSAYGRGRGDGPGEPLASVGDRPTRRRSGSRPMVSPTVAPPRFSPRARVLTLVAVAVLATGAVYGYRAMLTPVPAAAVAPTSDAQPYVRDYAQDLHGTVLEPLPTPQTYSHGANLDGCDRAYGAHNECVPLHFPRGVADTPAAKCAWLRQQGFRKLEVPGTDHHELVPAGGPTAPGGNPYACPAQLL